MNVFALAIESNISLSNSIVLANSPEEALDKLLHCLEMFDGEEIHLICGDVVLQRNQYYEGEAEDLRKQLERMFEQAVPELFAPGYFDGEE